MINFFGTWCPPCRAELPILDEFQDNHSNRVILLGIALNIRVSSVRRFLTENNLTFPVILASEKKNVGIPERYDIPTIPTTVLINTERKIAYYHPGMVTENDVRHLEQIIQSYEMSLR